jgi:streptogramin lyase
MAAMFGGIALRGKLLVTLSGGLEGEVRVYDLGARRLVRQIPVPARVAGRVEAGGVAIDADSSFWVADGAACQLRRFNPFGGELEPIGLEPTRSKPRDRRGLPAQARGVALDAHERLWVSGGDRPRVHGLQVFEREGRFVQSIAAFGRREGLYGPAYAVRILEDRVWLADTGNHCLQQFRDDGSFVARYDIRRICQGAGQPIDIAPYRGGLAVLLLDPEPRLFAIDAEMERGEAVIVGRGLVLPSGLVAAPGGGLWISNCEGQQLMELDAEGEPGPGIAVGGV